MNQISLDEAIINIKQSCKDHNSSHSFPGYSFVVGAGISCPEVPLASEIEDECRKIIENKMKGKAKFIAKPYS